MLDYIVKNKCLGFFSSFKMTWSGSLFLYASLIPGFSLGATFLFRLVFFLVEKNDYFTLRPPYAHHYVKNEKEFLPLGQWEFWALSVGLMCLLLTNHSRQEIRVLPGGKTLVLPDSLMLEKQAMLCKCTSTQLFPPEEKWYSCLEAHQFHWESSQFHRLG